MPTVAFRLTHNMDPEERLEEAALWKALCDFYGEEIVPFDDTKEEAPDLPTFGRTSSSFCKPDRNPIPSRLDYWSDPAFKEHAHRDFWICDWEAAVRQVNVLHSRGDTAFVKSTKSKHWICNVPVGSTLYDAMGDMAYSFLDGGPDLIVQEFIPMQYEHRFFVIDRKIVTDSPVQTRLTPIDHPLPQGSVSPTPEATNLEINFAAYTELRRVAEEVAATMEFPHACVDCAITTPPDQPLGIGCLIEMNPMQLGQLGLFACDVRALAKASPALLRNYKPTTDLAFTI